MDGTGYIERHEVNDCSYQIVKCFYNLEIDHKTLFQLNKGAPGLVRHYESHCSLEMPGESRQMATISILWL